MNNFDAVAGSYDSLARVVFGDEIAKSQACFLDEVSPKDKVLVVGGGTGQVLEWLPACDQIDYLEKSEKMQDLAQQRLCSSMVHFIEVDFLDATLNGQYDVVICQYFLDCFKPETLDTALSKIKKLLKKEGTLIVADFCYPSSHIISRAMHVFFRLFADIEGKKLQDIHSFVSKHRFVEEKVIFFHHNRIFSRLYRNL